MLVWILSYEREKYFLLFFVKTATSPEKSHSPTPPSFQANPSKSWGPVKPRPHFKNLVGGSNTPLPLPSKKGDGGCTLWVICGISVAYFQWHVFCFQDILNIKDRYFSIYSNAYYEVSIKIINEDLSEFDNHECLN